LEAEIDGAARIARNILESNEPLFTDSGKHSATAKQRCA
jgi:hypothetical protein